MKCRHCNAVLQHTFLDLGLAPPSNAYLSADTLMRPEVCYPLSVKVCDHCWLVQTEDHVAADALFTADYAYFSSTSSSWVTHARDYSREITQDLGLSAHSLVIEVGANDGYMLKNFVTRNIPCIGIEPTINTAAAAEAQGIPMLRDFFSYPLARRLAAAGKMADLIIGNNVYAHVPDINDFTRGLKLILKPEGTITLEFPHLLRLIEQVQFDTVYHEHFSYLSLAIVSRIFSAAGLRVWHVKELPTHGGSLRVYGCHADDPRETRESVNRILEEESRAGLQEVQTYLEFQPRADKIRDDLLAFLIEQKHLGKTVAAYGAAAKGNTLLNYAGVKSDLLAYVCDAAVAKQNKYLPGSHIPILSPDAMKQTPPDYVLILPWNLAEEVMQKLRTTLPNTQFVTAVPELRIA